MALKSTTTEVSKKRSATRSNILQQQVLAGTGKLPPQALDLEEVVLGALLLEKDALNHVIEILRAECFYSDANKKIFEAILALAAISKPIDMLTVIEMLKHQGTLEIIGGPHYVTQLTMRVASSANIEYHARIILQKFIQRELIRISSETIQLAYEDTTDVLDLLDRAEQNLFAISEMNVRRKYNEMPALVMEALKEYETAGNLKSDVLGVPSGFTDLDRYTLGWQKSDLIILAARPAMGKTSLVLSLARNAAVRFNKPVAFFSLEMTSKQLITRLISSESEISSDKLRKGQLAGHEWEQLNSKINALSQAPIYIDDTPALSVFEFRAKCRRMKAEHRIELVVIDYLQLMVSGNESRSGTREQEISYISRSLKNIAKELDLPIIALSQLSRAVEARREGSKKPMLSDLRDSGAIEQDADMVLFIHRPEYYGMTEDADGNPTTGIANIILAKNRNGSIGEINLRFINHLTRFTDLDNYNFEEAFPDFRPDISDRITRKSRMDEMGDDEPAF
ncbi:MAG: replicative DNA helicase [Bacteroidia bacterium]|nr:replicative DNA helicase [Bacteroidia bacterium]MCZ2277713.1 replicative DNA helicase [Bacteroidia bacterium]